MPGLVPGHPRLSSSMAAKMWMAGTSPAITKKCPVTEKLTILTLEYD
jgi:hypothetical protein